MKNKDILNHLRKEFEREKQANDTISDKTEKYSEYYTELENLRNKYNFRDLESALNIAQNDLDVIMTRKVKLYCSYIGNILKFFSDKGFDKRKIAQCFADNGINVNLHGFDINDFLYFADFMETSDYDIAYGEVIVGYEYPIYINLDVFKDRDYLKNLDKEFAKL